MTQPITQAITQIPQSHSSDQNFCPRCGKRLQGMIFPSGIHTCTPPTQVILRERNT